MDMLGQMSWGQWFLGMAIIGTCGLLMLVILLQRGRGEGLAGAFGGGGGGGAFGAKTGDVFTVVTVVMAAVFLLLAVIANFAYDESVPSAATTTSVPADSTQDLGPISVTPVEVTDETAGDVPLITESATDLSGDAASEVEDALPAATDEAASPEPDESAADAGRESEKAATP